MYTHTSKVFDGFSQSRVHIKGSRRGITHLARTNELNISENLYLGKYHIGIMQIQISWGNMDIIVVNNCTYMHIYKGINLAFY